jgi:hypothetical protein
MIKVQTPHNYKNMIFYKKINFILIKNRKINYVKKIFQLNNLRC